MSPAHRSRTIAAAGLGLAAAVAGLITTWPEGPRDSDYFGPNEPTWVRVPTILGDPVYLGVLVLHALPGDAIVLESLGLDRVEGDASVDAMFRILGDETQTMGGIPASALPDTIDLTTYGSLSGFRFAAADGPVEFSLRISGTSPIHGFDGLWLRFARNGEATIIEDWIPMRATVCTGSTFDQAVERCRPIEAQMHSFGL